METLQEIAKLKELYEKTLEIKKSKLKKQIILCPVGHIASGKTTVVKPVASELGLIRLSTDELRVLARDNNLGEHTHVVVGELFREYLKKGFSIACDFDCSSLGRRDLIEAEAVLYNAPIIFIKINPPHSWIIHKIKSMKYFKSGLFKNVTVGLSEIKRSFKERKLPNLKYAWVFDTSSPKLDKEIGDFCKYLEERY